MSKVSIIRKIDKLKVSLIFFAVIISCESYKREVRSRDADIARQVNTIYLMKQCNVYKILDPSLGKIIHKKIQYYQKLNLKINSMYVLSYNLESEHFCFGVDNNLLHAYRKEGKKLTLSDNKDIILIDSNIIYLYMRDSTIDRIVAQDSVLSSPYTDSIPIPIYIHKQPGYGILPSLWIDDIYFQKKEKTYKILRKDRRVFHGYKDNYKRYTKPKK